MKRRFRILLYGDFQWDRLAASYQRAFEAVGHEIIPFDVRKMRAYLAPWLRSRIIHRMTIRSLSMRRLGSHRWNRLFADAISTARPDFTLILNGDYIMPESLAWLRRQRHRVFIFNADNPMPGLPNHRPEWLAAAQECDGYFIWSRSLVCRLRTAGVPRVELLLFGWDPEIFPYYGPAAESEFDVAFPGGWDRDREEFLEPIARRFRLTIWGPDYWVKRTRPGSPLRMCWGGDVQGRNVSYAMARAKIVLNIFRHQNLPDGVVARTFEVPGSGAFLLSTRTSGGIGILPEGEAGAYFGDTQECIEAIERWLADDAGRRQMAARAHRIVAEHHTLRDRAAEILQYVDGS